MKVNISSVFNLLFIIKFIPFSWIFLYKLTTKFCPLLSLVTNCTKLCNLHISSKESL